MNRKAQNDERPASGCTRQRATRTAGAARRYTLSLAAPAVRERENAFSKCWRNHKAALALFFAWYNFLKMHGSVRMTPAMAANVASRPWSMRDLMEAAGA